MENQLTVPAKRSIYHISADHYELMRQIENLEGEITDEIALALTINKDELEAKGASYAYAMKQFDNEIKLIDEERERLAGLKSSKLKTREKLETTLKNSMIEYGITKIESKFIKVNTFHSKQLVIADDATIPASYIKTKEVETVDKAGLKKAVEQGEEFTGIWIQQNTNLKIS